MSNHMTLDDRQNILLGLNTGESFSSIGKRIGKSVSTIGREIRNHRIVSETSGYGRVPNRCVHRFDCTVIELCQPCEKPNQPLCRHCRLCNQMCEEFQEERCARLDKPPYVCNGCMDRKACTLRKFIYDPCNAQDKYRTVLTESREGFNLTEREIMGIDKLVSPLLKKGQSVHHIVVNHKDELTVSEQTIERLIDASALSYLPEEQRRKNRIKHRKAKQKEVRVDRKCRIGRTLEDYNLFMQSHPQASPVQMDTVIGEIGGKCLFTMFFVNCSLMLAFLCDRNTAACIHEKIESLYNGLGQELFAGLFPVLLTDNGSEFS